MSVYGISAQPKFISGVFTRPYIVKNNGTGTVYLGQDSSLTIATRAFSLPSGSTLNWSGDTELWAVTDVGSTGELELLFTGENSFSPGPSTVFAKASSQVVELERITVPIVVGAGAPAGVYASSFIDVAVYSSIIVTVEFSGVAPIAVANFMDCSLLMQNANNNNPSSLQKVYSPQWLIDDSAYGLTIKAKNYIQIPVTQKYLKLSGFYTKNATALGGTATIIIYGSNETVSRPEYVSQSLSLVGTLTVGGIQSQSVNAPYNVSQFLCTDNLGNDISLQKGTGGTGFVNFYACDSGVAQFVTALAIPAAFVAGETQRVTFTFPMRPTQYQLFAGAGNVLLGIT